MRKALLTSSVAILTAATMVTGTASAAGTAKQRNTIDLFHLYDASQSAGDGKVSSDTAQGNAAIVEQDGTRNLAIIGQRTLTRKLQIGKDTASSTYQENFLGLLQRADGDNDAYVKQKSWNKTTQRSCLIDGGPDLNLGVGAAAGVGIGVSLFGRNIAVVEQVNAHLGIQRSC